MSVHVIVGAGAIGSATARLLSERGEHVLLISRSGSGPELPGVRLVRADASDAVALADLTMEAAVLYNCASPAYHQWASDWPPLAASLQHAAQRSGAVLATVSNLYGYGPVTAPMTEDTPLRPHGKKGEVRAHMWRDALALHEAGLVRVTEVRSSDYIGPNSNSHLGDRIVPRVLAGKSVQVLPSADTPHTWTYVQDVARLLTIVGIDDQAWGRAWHVPSNSPRTQREAINDLARIAAVRPVKVGEVSRLLLRAMGLFNPFMREIPEVAYQFTSPFILDASSAERTFGLTATPWDDVLAKTIDSYRATQPRDASVNDQ